jgi:hypothetical protein
MGKDLMLRVSATLGENCFGENVKDDAILPMASIGDKTA